MTSTATALAKPYFKSLTGVRAIAAYLVFFHHFNPFPAASWPGKLVGQGHVGVPIFFVLSGFLITIRYQSHFSLSKEWLLNYMRNRVARIYPLYFLLTVLTFLVLEFKPVWSNAPEQWEHYTHLDKAMVAGLNLTFLRGFFNDIKFSGVGPGWTLTVEECFYFSAPLLLLFLRRTKWAVVGYIAVLLLLGFATVHFLEPWQRRIPFAPFSTYAFMLNYTLFGRCFDFAAGIALALWVQQRKDATVATWPWRTMLGLSWIIGAMIILPGLDGPEDTLATVVEPAVYLVRTMLLPIGVAIFFAGLLYEKSLLRRVLETSMFKLLGESSYAFYLVHIGVLSQLFEVYLPWMPLWLRFLATVGVSILLFKFIEKPLHKRIAQPKLVSPSTWVAA